MPHALSHWPLRRSVIACALMLASLPATLPAAQAQQTSITDDSAAIDQVTVVGSRARNRHAAAGQRRRRVFLRHRQQAQVRRQRLLPLSGRPVQHGGDLPGAGRGIHARDLSKLAGATPPPTRPARSPTRRRARKPAPVCVRRTHSTAAARCARCTPTVQQLARAGAGADRLPQRNTSVTVDAYRIKIRDRITRSSDLQSDAATAYLTGISRSDIQSVAYLANLLDTSTTGLDAVVNHDLPFADGKLDVSAALNLNKTRIDDVHQRSTALAGIDPTYGGALPYNFINPIGVNGAYFYGRLRYTF